MKRKRLVALALALALAMMSLAGCSSSSSSSSDSDTSSSEEAEDEVEEEETEEAEEETEEAEEETVVGTSSVSDEVEVTTEQVDNLTIVLPQASFDLAPFSSGRVTALEWYMLYMTLMARTETGQSWDEMEPRIAKTVTQVSDTVYDFELFDYIYDSQGNDITAEDVVYSFEYAASIGAYTCLGSYLDSIVALDDYNVEITLKDSTTGGIEQLMDYVIIIDKDWHENASEEERSQNPATTGAYYVDSVTSGSGFVLKAKEDFWQTDEEYISTVDHQTSAQITYTVIAEMSMVSVALENKEVDLAEIDGTISENFINDDGTAKDGYNFYTYQVNKFNVLEFNCSEDSPFNDIYLRQACAYALDAELIMTAAGVPLGMGTVCHTFGNSAAALYNDAWDDEDYYGYDLDKAKELIAQSSYDGEEVHLLFAISTAENVGVVIQAELAEIGVNVVIDAVEQALYDTMILDSTEWDMATRLVEASDYITSGWTSRFDSNNFTESGTGNFVQDEELQTLLAAAVNTLSEEDIDAFHYYLKDQCYSYGLYTANKCYIGQEGVLSLGGTYQGNTIFNNVAFTTDYVSTLYQ